MSIARLQEEANSLYFNFQAAERKALAAIMEARSRGAHDEADAMFEEKRKASKAARAALDEIEMKVLDDATAKKLIDDLAAAADGARAHLHRVQETALTLDTLRQMAQLADGLLKIVSRLL